MTKILFTVEEATALGHVSRAHVYNAIRTGALPSTRPGKRRLIRRECLARWLGIPESDLARATGAEESAA